MARGGAQQRSLKIEHGGTRRWLANPIVPPGTKLERTSPGKILGVPEDRGTDVDAAVGATISSMVQLFLEPHQLRRVNRDLVRYVRRNFPMRFYRREGKWPVCAAAALLRMCDTVDAIMALMGKRKLADARVLLRSLYEQVVVFAWVAIDPDTRLERWEGASKKEQLKLHNEARRYGETILTSKEVAEYGSLSGLPSAESMAHEVDKHWPGKVSGLHDAGGLLSFHGLYLAVYRVGSRPTHGAFAALDPYVQIRAYRKPVAASTVAEATEHTMLVYSLAAPLFGIALLIAARDFAWLDETEVQRFINRATAEVARQRAARKDRGANQTLP